MAISFDRGAMMDLIAVRRHWSRGTLCRSCGLTSPKSRAFSVTGNARCPLDISCDFECVQLRMLLGRARAMPFLAFLKRVQASILSSFALGDLDTDFVLG